MFKKRFWFPIFAILAIFIATLACGENVSPSKVGEVESADTTEEESLPDPTEPSEEDAPSPTATTQQLTTYQVGDIITIGDMVMVVLGWDKPTGDDFNKPDEGKEFVAVEVLMVNKGSEAGSVSSLLQMALKDETGQRYDVDLMAQAASGSSPEGEMSPGERLRGKVGFQVPVDATGLVFVYDANVFGTGKVFVELGPEPISVEPPSEIAGETEQTTYSVGDVIEVGDLTMVVNEVTYPEGDEFNKPDEGNKFVVVDLTLENRGAEAATISTLMQMSLKDATGQRYDVDLMAEVASGGASPDGELAPGEKLRGQVGFQVPETAEGLVFVYDADVFGYGKVFIALP